MSQQLWIKDKKHCWVLGRVTSDLGDEIEVDDGSRVVRVNRADTLAFDPTHTNDVDDIATMNNLTEAPLLDLLRRRLLTPVRYIISKV